VDPEKRKSDSPSESPSDRASARSRVDRLTDPDSRYSDSSPAGKSPGASDPGGEPASEAPSPDRTSSAKSSSRPQLTERQRIEARELRRQKRRSGGRAGGKAGTGRSRGSGGTGGQDGGPTGNPLSRGVRATWLEIRRTAGYVWGLVLTGLDRLGPAVRYVTSGLISLLAVAGRGLAGIGRLVARASSRIGAGLLALDRVVTPRRALVAVAGAGVVALAASQFIDFRATEIGRAGYDPIRDITSAPRTDVLTPIDAHSIALLFIAGLALAGVVGIALTGKRLFGGLLTLAGAATLAVALLVDLPKGLDIAEAEISYSAVAAVLLSGFWIELAAGLVLVFAGLGLLLLSADGKSRATNRESDNRRSDSNSRGTGAGGGEREGRDREGGRPARREGNPRPADAGGLS
jgi:hypothetical protein